MKSASDLNRWDGPYDPIGDLEKMSVLPLVMKDRDRDFGYVLAEVFDKMYREMGLPPHIVVGQLKKVSYTIAQQHAEITRKNIEKALRGFIYDSNDSSSIRTGSE